MAEIVVNFVLGKLGELIVKEAQFLGEVGNKVKWVETELIRIKCYLTDADSKRRKGDARAENWLNELRDVAYRIEDATDTFYVEIEDNCQDVEGSRQKHRGFFDKLRRFGHKTTKLPAVHELGTELDDIKKVLEGIFASTVHYQINPLEERGETVPMPSRRTTFQDVDETEVVGLDEDKNNVCKLLLDSEIRKRAVVTIVGPGGLGKTTLAHMVYKSVQANFNFHMMLPVSQQYNPTDLLRNMLTKLKGKGSDEPSTQDIGDLISELKGLLSSKRYLIILDDVWVADLWNQYLKYALPDVENGSWVLMTSRLIEVAQSVDPTMEPYQLKFLNEKDSRNLLLKKSLPYQNPDEKCSDDLLKLADALSKKCEGLPLALVVLGGILSTKNPYPAWEQVLQTMDWHSDGKDCINILAMSYEDMPYYLKTCFLYLASFPEDFKISGKRLIRMWEAEGFMPQQGRKSMEKIADDCLEELFQRCMVQVSSRRADGSIKHCRVHDLLRDFAMHRARKENFVTVFANPQDINNRDRATRRASLQSCDPQLMKYVGPKTRSLFLFGLESNLPNYFEFRLLRVLLIEKNRIPINLKGVHRLIHLKYLGLRYCERIDMSECSLGNLNNLETLDVHTHKILKLPTDLWTIITLRHVVSDWLPEAPSTADLRNLQTLEWYPFNNETIPCLNNLRRLGLESKSNEWDVDHAVPHLLGGLPSLISLKIISRKSNLPMEIVYPRALPNYQNLQILYLEGEWSKSVTLKASLFPTHLIKLTLYDSELGRDPMPELGKLNNLKELVLLEDVYYGDQMICAAGFPVLQSLTVHCYDAHDITVAKGVMPNLKHLSGHDRAKFKMPPELMHLLQQRRKKVAAEKRIFYI